EGWSEIVLITLQSFEPLLISRPSTHIQNEM
ncbi:hypothetical protein LCGC14_3060150, partial [marine sediment metagenome]